MGNSYSNFAERRLNNLSKNGELEIGFIPQIDTKADKPEANKPPAKYANPYEEYIKTWEPGDVIPLVPPGKKMHFCTFNPNMLDTDSTFFRSTHKHSSPTKFKSGEPDDIEYKVLGRKLKDSLESLLRRAAKTRGLWVDDKNKLRCPPGTPAANQFTDITGSNCFIPSPRTAAQSGARAVRRTITGATQMSTQVGGRVANGFDAARANAEQIRELGFERVQESMAYGGRMAPTPQMVGETISGAMRATRFGLIPNPSASTAGKKRSAPVGDVWQLGLKEQIWRGKRATELARSLRDRFDNPNRPDGLKLPPSQNFPAGRPIGDISQKAQFVSAMAELFPNVPQGEIEEMFDQAIPLSLSRMEKSKLKASLVQYWYSWIENAIANPEQAKWITSFEINTQMQSAFEVDFGAFAPSPSTGGRRISQAASNAAQGRSAEQGGVQFSIRMNPFEMWSQVNRSGFDRNGRANGVADSVEGDMHYLANHEWGHVAHFSNVMETLGFQTQNLQRYPMAQNLVKPPPGGPSTPQWQRQKQVNAWIVDFRQAANPTGNRSMQLLIDSANNLSRRQYVRSGTWGGSTGYTRQDLEADLNNFHLALAEAVENNITDDADDQLLMKQFAGGVYASTLNLEARAEFFAARRLFGDPALTGGQTGVPSTVDEFARTMAAAQGAPRTQAQYRAQLDSIGYNVFGVPGNAWNISGRMAGSGLSQQRPTLKTQAVRRAVDQNYPRSSRSRSSSSITGAMRSSSLQSRTTASRDWKNQDTISSINTNRPFTEERQALPRMLQSALGAQQSSTPIVGRMSSQGGESRIKKNKEGVPQYPRTPTYGPMLGETENIFAGVNSWEEFKQRYNDQEIVFLDYETTGLVFDKYGRATENGNPVEIGAIKVKNGQVIERFSTFVNPGKPLQQWSKDNLRDADGNSLTDEYLQGTESLESGHRKLVEFAGPNAVMGVQNAAYDKNVLEDTLREAGIEWQAKGWIDLKDMAGMTLPRYTDENPDGPYKTNKDGTKSPSNGLADITRYLGVPLGKEHHRADKDAEATAESMRLLIDGAIEKNWSKDALDKARRSAYVKKTQDDFDSDVKEWESELAKYLGDGVSGKMSSSPALRSAPQFGRRQSREFYSSVPSSKLWRPETLEQSEPLRIAKRQEIIKDIKGFIESGDGDAKYMSAMNGLDPEFANYIRNTEDREILADLRQAAVEFHAGIDQRPHLNVNTAELLNLMENGLRRDDSSKPRRLSERVKAYEADIGISPDLPDAERPITGYMVHSDGEFAEQEASFREFSNKIDANSPRYKFDFFKSGNENRNNGFNSIFGDAEIILKPETGQRTAYGNGDALDNHIFPVLANSTDSDEIGRALIDPNGRFDERESNAIELLYGKFKNDFNAYRKDNGQTRPQISGAWGNRDALIMGGIEPGDIEEVRVPFNSLDVANSTTPEEFAKKPRELKYLPVTEYVDEDPMSAATAPAAPPSPPDPPDDDNNMTSEEISKIQEKMKRSFASTKDEQKIIEDILSGVEPLNAIPKNLSIRIDNVNEYRKIADDFRNLRRIEEAERLQRLAKARGFGLAVTNDYGLDVFDGRSFSSKAPKSKTSKEVIEAKIDKQIEELIESMRQAKFKNIKNISDSRSRLEKMQEEFDKLTDDRNNK